MNAKNVTWRMAGVCLCAGLACSAWAEETNSMPAAKPAPAAEEAKAADTPAPVDFEARTFTLKYAKATEVADSLNQLCKQLGVKESAVAFPEAHTVVVAAAPKAVEACAKVISEIDRKPKQVYVEARFLDLLMADIDKFGVYWSMLNGLTLNGTVDAGYGKEAGKGDHGYYQGTLSASDLQIVLKALRANNDNRMFANPRIVVSSGKTATVDITTKRPNVIISAKRTTGNGSDDFDVDSKLQAIPGKDKLMFADEAFFWWGISMKVEPYVAEDGVITAHIVPNVSALSDVTVQDEGAYVEASSKAGGTDVPTSKFPIIDVKRLETEFSLKSGETAVIGGLSKTEFQEIETGIPYLWKIPVIGPYLFGHREKIKRQREIVVFVTVGLVDPDAPDKGAGLPKNAFISREYVNGTNKEPGDHTREELIRMYRQDEKPNAIKLDDE